jgi:hypothetical protein
MFACFTGETFVMAELDDCNGNDCDSCVCELVDAGAVTTRFEDFGLCKIPTREGVDEVGGLGGEPLPFVFPSLDEGTVSDG